MIIINADIITWEENNRIVKNGAIVFQEDRIVEIGPLREMIEKYKQETIMDAHGAFIMPGSICAHTHFYGAFSRGMAIPGEAPKDLVEILEKLWWPLDKSLTEDAVKYSALVCQIDAIRHGTTTLIDHHASPFALENSLDIIADTVEQSGLRAVLCYEVTDRDGIAKAEAGIAENVRFIQALRKEPKPRIRAVLSFFPSPFLSVAPRHATQRFDESRGPAFPEAAALPLKQGNRPAFRVNFYYNHHAKSNNVKTNKKRTKFCSGPAGVEAGGPGGSPHKNFLQIYKFNKSFIIYV